MFHLPACSPELSPNEGVHTNLKRAVTRKVSARSKPQHKRAVINHTRELSRVPKRICAIFWHPQFRYGA